jgi:hypothetical protein
MEKEYIRKAAIAIVIGTILSFVLWLTVTGV